jgi:hypothetical protein
MAKYKLLKDLPNLKKGTILSEGKPIFGVKTLITKNNGVGTTFIDNELFEDFFEEIQEEPTDSIHWNPRIGERCFILENANIIPTLYTVKPRDCNAWRTGKIFRTEEECEKARERELAEVRLRRTSTFKPALKSGMYAYTVGYDFKHERLYVTKLVDVIIGNPITYKSFEEAERSIEKNREYWMIYFGIKKDKEE